MALFSRRQGDAGNAENPGDSADSADADAGNATEVVNGAGGETDAAADVGIAVTSFRGLGADASAGAVQAADDAQEAPAPAAGSASRTSERPAHETVPGLRDNVLLRETLARLPERATGQDMIEVARQMLQGHVFLRIKGDARDLIAKGGELPLASAAVGDRRFGVAYSSGAALADSIRLDGDADTTAMAQPVLAVLRHLLAGTADGLILDPASAPRRAILPRDLVERMVEAADERLELKTLLVGERTPRTDELIADALTRVRVWVAVNRTPDGSSGLAEGRTADGARFLEVSSHPLEVVAMGRGDRPAPLTPQQLAAALRSDEGITGVVIDPRGPWARLGRAALAPVLALSG